jgi:hypothetical protein
MASQNRNILNYLMTGKTITPIQALKLFDCFSLAQRIANIKKLLPDSYSIENVGEKNKKGKLYGKYVMYGPGLRRKF